jgi:hypothetical protein
MASQNGVRGHLLKLLADRKTKKVQLLDSIREPLDNLESDIKAIERTLALHDELETSTPAQKSIISPDELRTNAKDQDEALDFIAEHCDGTVHYAEARDIILAAGLSKAKPINLASYLYRRMANSEKWEWIDRGKFRRIKAESLSK